MIVHIRSGAEVASEAQPRSADLLEVIRAAIVRGDYSPNERLVEGDLAAAFAASRGAVRAALIALSMEGLVERETNRGARVRAISRDEAIEICEVRMALEGLLAGRAARRAGPAQAAELTGVIEQMEAAVEAVDVAAYAELNRCLHRRIRELAAHASAARFVELVRNQGVRISLALALAPGRLAASLEEHRAIVDAISRGDASEAEGAMRDHLARLVDVLGSLDGQRIR